MSRPSTKWIVTQVTALHTLLISVIALGHWGTPQTIAAVGILAQAIIGYVAPNTRVDLDNQARAHE